MLAMAVAILAVVAGVDLAVVIFFGVTDGTAGAGQDALVAQTVVLASLGTLVVILGGALLAWFGLRGGGRSVAESLGGREVLHGTADADERRLLNVVEEMALASGGPCPSSPSTMTASTPSPPATPPPTPPSASPVAPCANCRATSCKAWSRTSSATSSMATCASTCA